MAAGGESFARDHTVVAPDLLGHGLSDKPRADYSVAAYANGMRDLLSVLDIDRVTVVGHSLGGGVAAQFAYTFPERCERLVLVGTGGIARSVSLLLRLAAAPNADLLMPSFGSPVFKVGARFAAQLLRLLGTDLGRDTEEILKVFDALPDAAARRAILRTLRSGVDWRGQVITMLDRAYLAEGMPTLLLVGGARRHHPGRPRPSGGGCHAREPARDLRGRRSLPPSLRSGALCRRGKGFPGGLRSFSFPSRRVAGQTPAGRARPHRPADRQPRRDAFWQREERDVTPTNQGPSRRRPDRAQGSLFMVTNSGLT